MIGYIKSYASDFWLTNQIVRLVLSPTTKRYFYFFPTASRRQPPCYLHDLSSLLTDGRRGTLGRLLLDVVRAWPPHRQDRRLWISAFPERHRLLFSSSRTSPMAGEASSAACCSTWSGPRSPGIAVFLTFLLTPFLASFLTHRSPTVRLQVCT
jgi:hypothetical protein